MEFRSCLVVLIVAIAFLVCPTVEAQAGSSEWQIAVAPYLWAAGMDGTMAIGELEQDIDYPFSDVISDLDFALMGHLDVRNEHWVIASDLVFVDLGRSETVQGPQGLNDVTVKNGIEMTLFELAGGYRVSPVFTLLVGGRWVDTTAELSVLDGIEGHHEEMSKSWLDPLVGINAFVPLSDKWWLGVRGDVGGFGVGSELTWQAYADIGFRVSHLVSIVLGYHALDMDYESDSGFKTAGLDLMISGPQLGVVFTF